MTYRSDGDAACLRRDALAQELREVRRRLARLPELERVMAATACEGRWTRMPGDARVRRCTRGEHDVYDLAAMTPAEVERLARAQLGDMGARLYRRADGRVTTVDCAGDRSARRASRWIVAIAALAVSAAVAGAVATRLARVPPDDDISYVLRSAWLDDEPVARPAIPIPASLMHFVDALPTLVDSRAGVEDRVIEDGLFRGRADGFARSCFGADRDRVPSHATPPPVRVSPL